MKKGFFKSFAAVVMAAVMTLGLAIPAMAATGDPITTATTVKGVAVTSVGDAISNFTTLAGDKGAVTLTAAQAANTSLGGVVADGDPADSTDVFKVAVADTGTFAIADLTTASTYDGSALQNGDWLVVAQALNDTSADFSTTEPDRIYIIVVTVTPADPDPASPGEGKYGVQKNTAEGQGTVPPVVFKVVVPTSFNFQINPLKLDNETGDASQIGGADYALTNGSEVPVTVSLDFGLVLATDVELVTDRDELDPTSMADDLEKAVFFAALGAKTFTASNGEINALPEDGMVDPEDVDIELSDYVYVATSGALVPFADVATPGETMKDSAGDDTVIAGEGKIEFALAALADGAQTTADNHAAFKFYGEMNTYAGWEDNDIGVIVGISLIALDKDTYAGYTEAFNADAHHQLTGGVPSEGGDEPGATVGFTNVGATGNGTATTSGTYTYSKTGIGTGTLTIPFNFATGVTTITNFKLSSGTAMVLNTDYTLSEEGIVLLNGRLRAMSATPKVFTFVHDGATYTLNVTPTA
jgi:hypothetical protein